ncbi:hypothetical protein KVV02_004702 [Mortierella alpina]|uniref:RNI-like protein n=1 Tax=Mortierella alpina TaxID=64518 RepID=A0A9P7ZZB0_MORAP|nr:hypothetical protein KVV02_004702 [Mortierella alpina]
MAWGGGNANNVDSWVKRLQENDASFTSLHILSFRRITSAELGQVFVAITHNSTLKEFYASGHALDQDAAHKLATALEHNRTLERLNVGHDGLGSDEAVFKILADGLAKSQAPLRLDLENKGLGGHDATVGALAAALEKNQALQELNLARNKLTDQDIATLCQSLAQSKSLQKLDLCLNSFGETGTRAVAELLAGQSDPHTPGLKEIDLSDNELTEEGGTAIGKALESNQQLERLRMSSCMDPPLPVEEDDEDKILWDHEVHDLTVRLTPEQEAEIRSDGDTVLEAIATALKHNQTLQELWMDYCNISSIGATFLATALRHNHGLTTIRMRNNRVGNRGARSIGAALTPTDSASLEKEEFTTGYNTTLKNLELGSNKVGVLGWHGLVGASSLESLGLFENGINVLHEALETHLISNLSPISSPPLPNPAAPVSASVPNGSSTARHVLENLIHLDVGCNGISRESFTQLGVCLIKGLIPSLMRLEIAGNGDRVQEPQHPGQGDSEESGRDDDEQNAWETVATRIEEARPGLAVHWKGSGAMQQQP